MGMLSGVGMLQMMKPSLLKRPLPQQLEASFSSEDDAPLYPTSSFQAPLQTTLVPDFSSGSGTPTFTRASTAYQQDFEGKYNAVLSGEARFQGARRVENHVGNSETLTVAAGWVKDVALTLTQGIADPLGGTTATRVTNTTGANGTFHWYIAATSPQATYLPSLWIRRAVGSGAISFLDTNANYGGAVINNITSSWQRIADIPRTDSINTRANVGIGLGTLDDAVDIWHPLLEYVNGQANQNPSEYVSVGVLSAPYHGASVDGVKYFDTLNGNTVASNVVTEATGAAIVTGASGVASWAPVDASGPFGYLSEGARADVLGTTAAIRRTMTDVGWVNGGTVTVGAATGADGVASAGASLTFGAVAATNTILFTTVLGAAVRTYGAWVRRKTGTGTIQMTVDAGVTWNTITLTTNYALFQQTSASVANQVVGFKGLTNLDAIEVDFNTLEAATFANPTPIPVNVSKAADALTYVAAGNASSSVGTAYAEVTENWLDANRSGSAAAAINVSNTSNILYWNTPVVLSISDGTTESLDSNFVASSSVQKIASYWGGSSMGTVIAGTKGVGASFDGNMNISNLNIGWHQNAATYAYFGTIRNVRIWLLPLISQLLVSKTRTL